MKLFDRIAELAEDDSCLIFLLIDEVESIVSARQTGQHNAEPGWTEIIYIYLSTIYYDIILLIFMPNSRYVIIQSVQL